MQKHKIGQQKKRIPTIIAVAYSDSKGLPCVGIAQGCTKDTAYRVETLTYEGGTEDFVAALSTTASQEAKETMYWKAHKAQVSGDYDVMVSWMCTSHLEDLLNKATGTIGGTLAIVMQSLAPDRQIVLFDTNPSDTEQLISMVVMDYRGVKDFQDRYLHGENHHIKLRRDG